MDSHHLLNLVKVPSKVSGAFTGRHFPESSSFPSLILLSIIDASANVSANSSFSSILGSLDLDQEGSLDRRLSGLPLWLLLEGRSSSSSLGSSPGSPPAAPGGCPGGRGGGDTLPGSVFPLRNSSLSLCALRNSSSWENRAAAVGLLFLVGTWASRSVISAVVLMDSALAALRLVVTSCRAFSRVLELASAVLTLVSRLAIALVCASFSFLLLVLSHCSLFLSWVISSLVSVVSPLNDDSSWFFFLAQVSSLVSSSFLRAASACTI